LHSLQTYPNTMGFTVTASHNPASYVGIKTVVPTPEGHKVHAIGMNSGPMGGLKIVRELYHNGEEFPSADGGSVTYHDLCREYIEYSMAEAGVKEGDLSGLTVVLEAMNGSAGPELHQAFTKAGCKVVAMRSVPNGLFPYGSPNPTSQGKMEPALEAAKGLAAEAGSLVVIGMDGDGDRMVFGDHRGILAAGFAFIPILQECGFAPGAEARPVLYDPKVNPVSLAEWGKLSAKPVLYRNGHSQIKDYMYQIGAIAAAEESGHYYHELNLGEVKGVTGENSCLTTLLFLKAVKKDAGLMDRLQAGQASVFVTGEFNYQFPDDDTRDKALAAVIKHYTDGGASSTTHGPDGSDLEGTCLEFGVTIDPPTVELKEGWYAGYLRVATNEKGVVRAYFSAGDAASGGEIEKQARDILGGTFGGNIVE